jgi:DNA-directed RNA polymerase specialized sigma24 family protein
MAPVPGDVTRRSVATSYLSMEVGRTTDGTRPQGDDEIFKRLQPELFGLAYRVLGSAVDAADIVADAYLRWRAAARDDIRDPRGYLATVVARLSVDALTSARTGREDFLGPWLSSGRRKPPPRDDYVM